MSQYQNLPVSTSTSTSTKKNIQYSTRPVPVQPKYWQYQYQYQYNNYWSNLTAEYEIFERKISYSWGKSKFRGQILNFRIWNWNLKRKIWHILENFMAANLFTWFLLFFCFGTGTDWLSTCAISTSTESVFENWTSTSTSISTSVPKMISGLKKSVPVAVDWLIYTFLCNPTTRFWP